MGQRRFGVARLLRGLAEDHEQIGHALAVRVARLQDPVVVEVDQQLLSTERQRVGVQSGRDQPVDLPHVDPELRPFRHPHPFALGDHVRAGGLAELPAQGGQRRPQARPSAALEHVGPEQRGHLGALVEPRAIREPGEQRASATAGDVVQPPPLQLEPKLAQQTDAQHQDAPGSSSSSARLVAAIQLSSRSGDQP